MMVSHIALWVDDLEGMRRFYERYFGARAGAKYENLKKCFESFFLSFDGGARLELMRDTRRSRSGEGSSSPPAHGWAHLAFSAGSPEAVDRLTEELAAAGFAVLSGPRHTGDGYYESAVTDPEGNTVEITV